MCSQSGTFEISAGISKYRTYLFSLLFCVLVNICDGFRTFVNIVPTPFVRSVVMVENKPFHCQMLHHGECSCWIGHLYNQNKKNQELYHRIQEEMHDVEYNVAQMKEFRNLDEFAGMSPHH